jgi:armadillo repeat-containing protein 8
MRLWSGVALTSLVQPLINAGILDVLCEHAHSMNPGLRLNSMWALKHLVHTADNGLKKRALEQLGSGWLVQLITADTEDEALYTRNRRKQEDEDVDMAEAALEDDERPWYWPGITKLSPSKVGLHRVIPQRMQQAERKLIALRETELNPVRRARNDDLAIQEQGLEFIRNLIGVPSSAEPNPETSNDMPEMVDYIFAQLGQDRLFEILSSKLRLRVLRPFARRNSGARGNDSRVIYPQAKVIESVVMLLVHMAASIPRHRQLVISQTDLLKQLALQLSSKDAEVRKALCHLLYNLAWQDDGDDAEDCTQRTLELKRLGFLAKLETLGKADRELDVRERAKLAAYQIEKTPHI